ncbi:MAG: hypothetical protein KHZ99_12040 [Clostridium sp.]|uniref:hypothetical protein n=1 Tax=Clostridium sp. TaxID=1506 RepID=UPI0025C5EF59|nr:hypothetical protein [Clostridium sp.]MBS4957762.1 hypothetical protein [Clostridium sp.]
MIKEFKMDYLDEVMKIWLETNINTHDFIEKEYWINNFDLVKFYLKNNFKRVNEKNNEDTKELEYEMIFS